MDQIKPRFSFWLKINFRKTASIKHVDLRKIESKGSKRKTANFWKPCKNFKIADEILAYKGKRWVIFDNDRKILNHNTTPFYRWSSTHLRHLNCKESKPFKCFNIKISYSFLFTRKFREYYFPQEYLFARKKQLPGVFISWEITTGELHIFTVTKELFPRRRN